MSHILRYTVFSLSFYYLPSSMLNQEQGKYVDTIRTGYPGLDTETLRKTFSDAGDNRGRDAACVVAEGYAYDCDHERGERDLECDRVHLRSKERIVLIFTQPCGNRCHGLFQVPHQGCLHRVFFGDF